MPNTNSLIGYVSATLTDPVAPSYGLSSIGYATGSLTDPAPASPYSPSAIGYASKAIGGSTVYGSSSIGFKSVTLAIPHRPVAVVAPGGTLRYVPILTWDGTKFR